VTERFEVGENEKHTITVAWSIFSKQLRIELDGEVVTSEWHLSLGATQVELDVGRSETHHVLVTAGGFHRTEVWVDGKKIQPST